MPAAVGVKTALGPTRSPSPLFQSHEWHRAASHRCAPQISCRIWHHRGCQGPMRLANQLPSAVSSLNILVTTGTLSVLPLYAMVSSSYG